MAEEKKDKKKPATKKTALKKTAKKQQPKKTAAKAAKKNNTKKVVAKKPVKKVEVTTEKEQPKVKVKTIVKEEVNSLISKAEKISANKDFRLPEVIILVMMFLLIGVCFGVLGSSIHTQNEKEQNIIATDDPIFNKLVTTYNYMHNKYIDDITKEELIEGAISGMLEVTGDPYTSYFDEKETTSFHKRLKGSFIGIGCEIVSDTRDVYIARVLDNSPASKAGLKAWDIIKSVNGVLVSGMTPSEVVSLIENSVTAQIDLMILRSGDEINLKMTKGLVIIESVTSKKIGSVGYIYIDLFAENTYIQFRENLLALEKEGIDSLIIDVRDNSGGFLNVVTDIASMFLSTDKVVYQIKDKDEITLHHAITLEKRKYEVAVLMNDNSASGSEILAGAIKEAYKGQVIGTNSFGKSTVQQTVDLGDGTMIKYTTQKWLTSAGTDVGINGLEPTIYIEQAPEYFANPTEANDAQLQAALSFLNK